LATFVGLLGIIACSSNADQVEIDHVPFSTETSSTLEGVNNDSIPFVGAPTDFSQVKADLPLLKKAIQAYESNDLETCSNALGSHFEKAGFTNLDQMLGYVVAAYGALGLYENAAREVLKRDQRRQPWNYAMKLDLMICLRNYAKQNGLEKGVALTEKLKAEFGKKLVSPILMILPRGKMTFLHDGMHVSSTIWWDKNKFEEHLPAFMERFPKDTFIDHAYYFIGEPEKALKVNPKGLLRDVLLYNIAYDEIKKICKEENRLKAVERQRSLEYISDYPLFTKKLEYVDLLEVENPKAEKAYQYFSKYIEEFPNRPHADDAAFWLAWLDFQYQRYDQAIAWTKKVRSLGNKDYHQKYRLAARLESEMSPFLSTKQLEAISTNSKEYDHRTEKIVINMADRLPFGEAIKMLEDPKYQAYEVKALYQLTKREYANLNFDNALEAAKLVQAKGENEISNISLVIPNIQAIIDLGAIPKAALLSKVATGLKSYFMDRAMTLKFIDQSIAKYGNEEDVSTLYYLKAVLLRDSNPAKVEAVVEEMLVRHTASKLCDDALAELIYVQSKVLRDLKKAEANLDRMFSLYPNGNALDNAMNWVAMGYAGQRYSVENGQFAREKAKYYYARIRREFPLTRFAGYAMQNLQRL